MPLDDSKTRRFTQSQPCWKGTVQLQAVDYTHVKWHAFSTKWGAGGTGNIFDIHTLSFWKVKTLISGKQGFLVAGFSFTCVNTYRQLRLFKLEFFSLTLTTPIGS